MMKDQGSCSTGQSCPVKGFAVPTAVVFAVIFGFEWFFHGIIMMPAYIETASLWRPPEAMQALFPLSILRQLVTAAIVTCLYCWIAKGSACGGKCHRTGTKFGLKIGLLLGVTNAGAYVYTPIPGSMAVLWLAGNIALGVLIGLALSFAFRCCKGKSSCSIDAGKPPAES